MYAFPYISAFKCYIIQVLNSTTRAYSIVRVQYILESQDWKTNYIAHFIKEICFPLV